MKIIIIIPTYNEKDNIGVLVRAIEKQQNKLNHQLEILVVDDRSPDGTAQLVKEMQQSRSHLHLLTGPKEGLGRAYIRGMSYALSHLAADVIMEMDADFSHDPNDIPRLIQELSDYDFVIGSRYVKGGSIPQQWNLLRKLNSKFGNIAARYIAGIYQVKDCTAGFRAIRAQLLQNIALEEMQADGYYFQVSLLHRCILQGARVKEVPVHFIDREKGQSKLGLADIIEFIVHVWLIRLENSKTFFKFLVVGTSGLLVNIGSLYLLLQSGMNKFLASPISIEISIISNFLLNNYWTFAQRKSHGSLRAKGLKFNMVALLALLLSYSFFVLISLAFPRVSPLIAQAISVIPATLINYFCNSYWTFRSRQLA